MTGVHWRKCSGADSGEDMKGRKSMGGMQGKMCRREKKIEERRSGGKGKGMK